MGTYFAAPAKSRHGAHAEQMRKIGQYASKVSITPMTHVRFVPLNWTLKITAALASDLGPIGTITGPSSRERGGGGNGRHQLPGKSRDIRRFGIDAEICRKVGSQSRSMGRLWT